MDANEQCPEKLAPQRRLRPWLYVVALMVGGYLLFLVVVVAQQWRSFHEQRLDVRLLSSERVIWGAEVVPLDSIARELTPSIREFRSSGFKPILVIECYEDTRDSDIAALEQIGKDAGFDRVEIERHDWPTPSRYVDNEAAQ